MTAHSGADGQVMTNRDGTRCLTQAININATPQKVWDLITRIATIADWCDTWDHVEPITAATHLRPGASLTSTTSAAWPRSTAR